MWDGFSNSFWSRDYITGINRAQRLINEGVEQNEKLLQLLHIRAKSASSCSDLLFKSFSKFNKHHPLNEESNDLPSDAAIHQLYESYLMEASLHKKLGEQLNILVINPFANWSKKYSRRVDEIVSAAIVKINNYNSRFSHVNSKKSNLTDRKPIPTSRKSNKSDSLASALSQLDINPSNVNKFDGLINIVDHPYTAEEFANVLLKLMKASTVKRKSYSHLGDYELVTNCSLLFEAIKTTFGLEKDSYVVKAGNQLIQHGLIRLLGIRRVFENDPEIDAQFTTKSQQLLKSYHLSILEVDPYFQVNDPITATNDDPVLQKYNLAYDNLEQCRHELELYLFMVFKDLEQAELDRLNAVKSVLVECSNYSGNFIPSLNSIFIDNLNSFKNLDSLRDMSTQINKHYTGYFIPVSNNELSTKDEYLFLQKSSLTEDNLIVSLVPKILAYLLDAYSYERDEEVLSCVWTTEVPLKDAFDLKSVLRKTDNVESVLNACVEKYTLSSITCSLRLCLLEFPDSLIRSSFYDYFKAIYTTYTDFEDLDHRLYSIKKCLLHLHSTPLHILEEIIRHLSAYAISIRMKDGQIRHLAKIISPCVLRPPDDLNIIPVEDTHPTLLVIDLINEFENLFADLERPSTPPVEIERALTPITTSPQKLKLPRSSSPCKNPSPTRRFRPF
ncbi:RhoGAP Rga9 [Schizosaccharomyces pombe]|uniref:Probable Rho-GTPase-activating protein 9 n=1 Tax=Schizosaccharomyces pombe (strain 972 / ATCC 24843) TaxID=284812 RepID=RGA9_SCHPO|nr:putative RhoGAP family GTPase-activator protein [Schizosaccharomyces pombe]Q9UUJ3.2 RecName: Full=Probable Rho-GTPase-activating protein 9 [Schizosaccharomyces pombe 972h-]CAB52580.2 RhoGAP, GTPase activator towards Rho/Rac/Cdc42-like small GTPases (predicted) [Schizosaccharomyces pombe]|eukprot:NP_001342903.1 putative RhoGAP family GTPase-activator protein [Schizosaccharomyces pombe]